MKLRTLRAANGMVAAGNPLAAAEGLAVLRAGGNAIDAAVAAAAVLAVVSPHECGLGGDLLGLVFESRSGQVHALNASGRSPAEATFQHYSEGIPQLGGGAVSVPGMVGGWAAAVDRFGSRPLRELLAGAIRYAQEGFLVYGDLVENACERIANIQGDPEARRLFLPCGEPLREGILLRQAGAATTLRAIAERGAAGFYRGEVACAMAAFIQARGGFLSIEDLADFSPLWATPMHACVGSTTVHTMPPNSWAAALLLQLAAMHREGIPRDEAAFVLQGIRTRTFAYSRLEGCIADPELAGNKAQDVLDTYLLRSQDAPPARSAVETPSGSDTSNIAVVDGQGNAVSILQSVFVPFGAGMVDPATGVLFNNRMRGFSTREGDINCVAPRKRPAQTLTPVLVTSNGRASIACSSPGGPGQTGTMAQFLARVLIRGESVADAIAAPRWSKTLTGDFILEDSAPAALRQAVLAAEPGVKMARWGSINFGSIVALVRDGDGWLGCADSRRNAVVQGL